jgi:nucleotide-binding universal stress UspA family protein
LNPYRRILHPTDLSNNCQPAFCHALRLALSNQGDLEILYCSTESGEPEFDRFPRVRQRLIRWGVLEEGASKQDVVDLGFTVRKQVVWGDPSQEIARESLERDADLMVMASHARAGWSRLLQSSVSNAAVQRAQLPGLLLPPEEEGFVNQRSGEFQLERILIPVAPEPDCWPALAAAARMAASLNPSSGTLLQVYVGSESDFPEVRCPQAPAGWTWERRLLTGEPVAELIGFAREWKPQLTAMSSQGRKSWRDHWLGSTLEQLLGQLPGPILVAPAEAIS